MRASSIARVTLLLLGACGPGAASTETIQLVDKRELEGVWRFAPSPGGDPLTVELRTHEARLELVEPAGAVAASVPITHLDLVRCDYGCSRLCLQADDVTRPWFERAYIEPSGPFPALTGSGTAGEALEVRSSEVCAR